MHRPFGLAATALALLITAPTFSPAADEPGFTPLFDGKTTQGWEEVGGKPGNWRVEAGILVTEGKGGWLSTASTYANSTIRLDFRTGKAGNSGIFLRTPREGDPAYVGMEIQLLDDGDDQYKALKPFQYTGSIYGVVAAERGHLKPTGEWNSIEVVAEGKKIRVTLNGATIVDADLAQHPEAATTHPGILRADGYIGLQAHSDRVEFRNIRIKTAR